MGAYDSMGAPTRGPSAPRSSSGGPGLLNNLPTQPAPTPSQLAIDTQNNLNSLMSYYAPTLAGFDAANANAYGRLGAIQSAANAGAGPARETADIRRRQLDNQIASVGVDINAIPRMLGFTDAQLGLQGQSKDATISMIDQLMGLTGKEYTNAAARAQLQLDTQRRQWMNDVASRGSQTAPETELRLEDFNRERELALDTANNQYASTRAGLANQRQQALIDWELKSLSATEQKAKLRDREAQLKLQADNYRLDQDALLSALEGQLVSMNLQGVLSAGQVLDGINSNNTQKAQFMNDLLWQATELARQNQIGSHNGAYGPPSSGPGRANSRGGGGGGW